MVTNVGRLHYWFSLITRSQYPPPRALWGLRAGIISFVLGAPAEGFGSLPCTSLRIVSLRVWSLLSEVLGEGDFSYGFLVFDFSHEEVKQAVVGIKVLFTP